MTRTVPGSGAVIEPIFDDIFGVKAVKVIEGGSGYDPADPPRLTITGCGTPDEDALLFPIIDEDSGKVIHVRVLKRGRGYDPLRLQIVPEQETPNVVRSFDINRIWQTHPNSPTSGVFNLSSGEKTDRLRIVSDNHPKPSIHSGIDAERQPGGSSLVVDRSFDQTFIYRGGKDVPNNGTRLFQNDKAIGILANGVLLHTPEFGPDGDPPAGFAIDTVKYDYVKNTNSFDAIVDSSNYFYQSSKVIDEFKRSNGVFEWGKIQVFTWRVKVEFDNVYLQVSNIDETLGQIEVGRIVDEVSGNARGTIAKVVRDDDGDVTHVYLRSVSTAASFSQGDVVLGSNGFNFTVAADPEVMVNGIFYIEFGEEAEEFGPFTTGQFYFAPENIRVPKNYLIIWDQSDTSNGVSETHPMGHPMQFSTTADGTHGSTPGTLYYNSTGVSEAPSTDYENEFRPLFIMNEDENGRVYYFCKNHPEMSGKEGHAGYMMRDQTAEDEPIINDYYVKNFYQSDSEDPNTIDRSRHVDGHSKVLGMSFDGYPIYGPYGYNSSGTAAREVSSYRLRTDAEMQGNRPAVSTVSTTTYAVTIADGEFKFDGTRPAFLNLERGKTYIFNQNDSSNESQMLLLSTLEDGWHSQTPSIIGNTDNLFDGPVTNGYGIEYYIDGEEVTYQNYLSGFNLASTRELRFTVPVNAPRILYILAYTTAGLGIRIVNDKYLRGDLVSDYIYDSATGTLDEYNGKFAVTPEYPNGTYAYFMTEDSSGNPAYPYAIANRFYSVPLFEGDTVPSPVDVFPTEAEGDVILNSNGSVSYIKITKKGDNFFGPAKARILGGQGTGAAGSPIVQTVTGLSLLQKGRNYATPPTLIFEGGGGQGAQGAAEIDTTGEVTSISIVDSGEFYQEPPYILLTGGGGIGAKAVAEIDQGEITAINITDPGKGYVTPPNVVFNKLVNLKRKTAARQSLNSEVIYLTGLVKDVAASDSEIFVDSTDAYPGSGDLIVGTETISYTGKSTGKFTGLSRGVNFNYDQRVILDAGQNGPDGDSTYEFNVGDIVQRAIESSNNKLARVYDWNPTTRELLVTFEIDELAFIDAGIPSTDDAVVQFDAGTPGSAPSGFDPHVLIDDEDNTIVTLTVPIATLVGRNFEDDDENEGDGDNIPDLVNTGTDYAGQIGLDGGIYNSLYGIEETQGGTNTTLFAVGDRVKDGSTPFRFATIDTAGALTDGVEHEALLDIYLDTDDGNGQNYSVNEVVTGDTSGVRGTVVSWDASTGRLQVKDIVPFDTGNINKGIAGLLYEFSHDSSVVDFIVQNPGTDYSTTPTVVIEDTGDIQATATVNMTSAGDQVESLTITNAGFGMEANIDGTYTYHPTVTFSGGTPDTAAVVQAVLGGEKLGGNGGASYRIKRIDYKTIVRS